MLHTRKQAIQMTGKPTFTTNKAFTFANKTLHYMLQNYFNFKII